MPASSGAPPIPRLAEDCQVGSSICKVAASRTMLRPISRSACDIGRMPPWQVFPPLCNNRPVEQGEVLESARFGPARRRRRMGGDERLERPPVGCARADRGRDLIGANCPSSYAGAGLGSWDAFCLFRARHHREADQVATASRLALTFARRHLHQLPAVVAARELRVWGFWDWRDQVRRDHNESRSRRWQAFGWPFGLAVVVAGICGIAVLLRKDPRAALPLVGVLFTVAVTAAAGYGNPRFNAIAHPCLACGIAAVISLHLPTPHRLRLALHRRALPGQQKEPLAASARAADSA